MLHLTTLAFKDLPGPQAGFPFNVPVIQALDRLEFTSPVTFLVGENGSGKSTLLEAIACAANSIVVGSEDLSRDQTLTAVRRLAFHLRLAWTKRTRKGFFLRAEDFFGYTRRMAELQHELETDLKTVDKEYQGRSKLASDLARSPYLSQLDGLQRRYGSGLDHASHGESFLKLFQARFVPGGLYLLDEPEVPLSPLRQLSLISLLKEMVDQQAQFIIATHSPILMAYPGASIWSFDSLPVRQVDWQELEHVTLTRSFLNDPQAYLRHL
ncbi:MAG: AAA family ATPase [Anaerolineales bacterium]|nr:AAA family ATPase [Anaerolineales bacterium]